MTEGNSLLIIERCAACPYANRNHTCNKLKLGKNKKANIINEVAFYEGPPPKWCPLNQEV